MTREELLVRMGQIQDPEYKDFNDRIANCRFLPSLGIRVPVLRKLAKEAVGTDGRKLLNELEQAGAAGRTAYQEEHMIWGMALGAMRLPLEERITGLDAWVPGILSWADCDTSVSGFKFMKKQQADWFHYCCRWLEDERPFAVRFALVALMQYFINDDYVDQCLEIFAGDFLQNWEPLPGGEEKPEYYVDMARAWALSVCFVKYREKTLAVFREGRMKPWVQNKAIQKCRESYRVSKEDKEYLAKLKK